MSFKPDFLIVGAAKCGTSSLAYNLNQHPDIFVWGGEIHYFTKYWQRGWDWYLSHFNTPAAIPSTLRGEKSPTYLYHTESHARIGELLPDAKLIVMMREPVARAYSNWNMRYRSKRLIRMGLEFNSRQPKSLRLKSLDFDALVDYYLDHYPQHAPQNNPKDNSVTDSLLFQQPLDIIHRGLYMEQIQSLLQYIKPDKILFLVNEHFFPGETEGYKKVCRFLNVAPKVPSSFVKRRTGQYHAPIPKDAARKLRDFYRPFNDTLFQFLGYPVEEWR